VGADFINMVLLESFRVDTFVQERPFPLAKTVKNLFPGPLADGNLEGSSLPQTDCGPSGHVPTAAIIAL